MKKHIISLITVLFFILLNPCRAAAQQDAAVLAPLIEKWEHSQAGQLASQLSAALNQWATQLESLEEGSKVAKFMTDAYKGINRGLEYKRAVESVYYGTQDLIQSCIYGYEWTRRSLSNGEITLSDATHFTYLLEFLYRKGLNNMKYAYSLFRNDSSGMTSTEKLTYAKETGNEMRQDAAAIDSVVSALEKKFQEQIEKDMADYLIKSMYGAAPDFSNRKIPIPNEFNVPVKDAKKDIEKQKKNSDILNSDDGKAINEVTGEVNSLGGTVLNFVCLIIGLLAVIMSIPAFMKVNKGEAQSQDALFKLFMGTVAIIAIIQSVGRLLITIN